MTKNNWSVENLSVAPTSRAGCKRYLEIIETGACLGRGNISMAASAAELETNFSPLRNAKTLKRENRKFPSLKKFSLDANFFVFFFD